MRATRGPASAFQGLLTIHSENEKKPLKVAGFGFEESLGRWCERKIHQRFFCHTYHLGSEPGRSFRQSADHSSSRSAVVETAKVRESRQCTVAWKCKNAYSRIYVVKKHIRGLFVRGELQKVVWVITHSIFDKLEFDGQ